MASLSCRRAFPLPLRPSSLRSLTRLPSQAPITHTTTTPFSTSAPRLVTGKEKVEGRYRAVPPYPYGYRQWYKKSNFGLFGNVRMRSGNNVSEQNEHKTRRRWYPNVHRKRLWSVALGRWVRIKVVTRVLRSIDKCGGLDEYLLGEKAGRVRELGPGGWALRWRVMRTDAVKERFARERIALGIVSEGGQVGTESKGVLVGDEEFSEEQLAAREAAIDEALTVDEQNAEQGIDGGVELEDLGQPEVEAPKIKRKW